MIIHVVQPGETIQSIADYYKISASRLMIDNGLEVTNKLVVGQSLVIVTPEIVYTVQAGDTLAGIAESYQVSLMQLFMNNPFLAEREYIYPGDTLVIQHNKKRKITTHGNTVPFIRTSVLEKTLPYLTYLSILNYTATAEGGIISYYEDEGVIQLAKLYGVIPLMLLTTLTITGEANIQLTYDLLLNEEFQEKQITFILDILESKGYAGVNLSFEYINVSNFPLYVTYFRKLSEILNEKGYLVFVTISPNISKVNNEVVFARVDYSVLEQLSQNIIYMSYEWSTNINPPSPILSVQDINEFLKYVNQYITPDKEILGLATIGYDWELPFSAGVSSVYSLNLERAIDLARNVEAIIEFDEVSQTPFFRYTIVSDGNQIEHIVWFVDARSINAILDLVSEYGLLGVGIWNITIYNPQLWLIINSQYEIEKVPQINT